MKTDCKRVTRKRLHRARRKIMKKYGNKRGAKIASHGS